MSDITAPVPTAAFTLAEHAHLDGWGRDRRMEVWVDNAGAEFADEVAYIGYGAGISPWTLHRADGALSLALIATRSGGSCKGWQINVGSVPDGLALILLNEPGV